MRIAVLASVRMVANASISHILAFCNVCALSRVEQVHVRRLLRVHRMQEVINLNGKAFIHQRANSFKEETRTTNRQLSANLP